jgi:hypothetical protein
VAGTLSPPSLSLIDEQLLRSPPIVRLAGGALLAVGFFVLGTAIQLTAIYDGWWWIAIAPVYALGASALVVAPQVYNGRGWAAVVGSVLALGSAGITVAWLGWLTATLVFAPMILLGVASSVLALLVVPFAVGPALQVSAARSRLW